MTIDGFLTFAGLIVALLALTTDSNRRALLLRPWASTAISVACGLLVMYFEFFENLAPRCPWETELCRFVTITGDTKENAQKAAFIVVLVWLALMAVNLSRKSLKARHLPRLQALISALIEERRFSEAFRITEPHIELIAKAAGPNAGEITEKQREAANLIQTALYKGKDAVRFVALNRPRIAVKMLAIENRPVFDFSDDVLSALIITADSPLYTEIAENKNSSISTGYYFEERNTYLHFLFSDARQAERLAVWRPVMEATIEKLQHARGGSYEELLGRSAKHFDEAKFRDQTFVAIRFLDLMVDAGLRQGNSWHMWLYYAAPILKGLLALYDESGPDVDQFDECPTIGSFLIYSLFDAMTDWIEAVRYLPSSSPHLSLKSIAATHENGNIPKSAIIALSDCLRLLLGSDKVSDRFRQTIVEDLVLNTLSKLPSDGERSGYRKVMIAGLLKAGGKEHSEYLRQLKSQFAAADYELRGRLGDFRDALSTALASG